MAAEVAQPGAALPETATAGVTGSSLVRFHPLRYREDGDLWRVGRVETGEFVAVPAVAVEAIRLLDRGLTVGAVGERLRCARGRDVDVASFVTSLMGCGFVAAVGGEPVPGPDPVRPTLPWLRPHRIRWVLSPVTAAVVLALPACAVVTMLLDPRLLPGYRDMLWTGRGSLVLLTTTVTGWTIILLHELAHLVTARADGVPGRIMFGTRLQFLVAQTDVSGIAGSPRRVRMTVYLAGTAVDLAVASLAVLGRLAVPAGSAVDRYLAAVVVVALSFPPLQMLVFVRTDLYFVLQDLTGCRNLYADGSARVRHLARRAWAAFLRRPTGPADPTAGLPPRERRVVGWYALLLAIGTPVCLGLAATITVPAAVTLAVRAGRSLGAPGTGVLERLDGGFTLLTVVAYWGLWSRAWWRRHGTRVSGWLARRRSPAGA